MGSCSKCVKTQPVEIAQRRRPASRSAATTSLSLLSKKIQLEVPPAAVDGIPKPSNLLFKGGGNL